MEDESIVRGVDGMSSGALSAMPVCQNGTCERDGVIGICNKTEGCKAEFEFDRLQFVSLFQRCTRLMNRARLPVHKVGDILHLPVSAAPSRHSLPQLRVFLMSLPRLPALQQLDRLNRSSSGFHDQLSSVLYGERYQQIGRASCRERVSPYV